jgi:hypothetical protein
MLANDTNDFADNLASTDTVQIKTLQQGWRNMMPVTLGMKYV